MESTSIGFLPTSTGIVTAGNTAAQSVQQPAGSKLTNTVNTLTKVVDSATGLVTAVKGSGAPTYDPTIALTQYQPGSSPMPEKKDNTKTILLVGGGLAVVGALVYFASKKKK